MEPNEYAKQAENLEKEAKFTIISMDDDDTSDKKKILDDAKEEINRLYREFREWLAGSINSEEVSEKLERLKQETTNLINRTKESVQAFQEREDVLAGKEKAKEFGNKLVDTLQDGIHEVMKNDTVSKVVESVNDTIDNVRHDERVVDGVKKMKQGTLKIAESAFNGLKRVLNTEDDHKDDQKG